MLIEDIAATSIIASFRCFSSQGATLVHLFSQNASHMPATSLTCFVFFHFQLNLNFHFCFTRLTCATFLICGFKFTFSLLDLLYIFHYILQQLFFLVSLHFAFTCRLIPQFLVKIPPICLPLHLLPFVIFFILALFVN